MAPAHTDLFGVPDAGMERKPFKATWTNGTPGEDGREPAAALRSAYMCLDQEITGAAGDRGFARCKRWRAVQANDGDA